MSVLSALPVLSSSAALRHAWVEWSGWLWQGQDTQAFPNQEQQWIEWLRGDGLREWQRLLLDISPELLASMMVASASALGTAPSSFVSAPSKVLKKEGSAAELYSLHYYALSSVSSSRGSVLLIPPCSHRSFIFDVSVEQSVVQKLLGQGFEVLLLEWHTPASEVMVSQAAPEWMAYRHALLSAFQQAACVHANVHVMGLCLGGVMVMEAMTHPDIAALFPPIQSMTLLSVLLDYDVLGALSCLQWSPLYRVLRAGLKTMPWLPPSSIYTMCCMLFPSGMRGGGEEGKIGSPSRSPLTRWSQEGLMVSTALSSELLEALCAQNVLLNPRAPGIASPLSQWNVPLYVVAGLKDRLVPVHGLFNGLHHCASTLPIRISLMESGHLRCFLPGRDISGYQGDWQGESEEQWQTTQPLSDELDWMADWGAWVTQF
jgi:polyhydroxyalkanoate synthase subunit PhaC